MARSRIDGVSKLRKSLRRMPEAVTKELTIVMAEAGRELEAEIRAGAPVAEGYLRDATTHQVSRDGLGVVAGYSQRRPGFKRAWKKGGFKSLWQEFGTIHHAKSPFISPAFKRVLPGILNRIDAAVERVLRAARSYGR